MFHQVTRALWVNTYKVLSHLIPLWTNLSIEARTLFLREDSQKPATKADAARKRNFSEIVDLTQFSDEEEPPAKKQTGFNSDIAPAWAAPPESVFRQHPPNSSSLPTMVPVDDKAKNMDVVQSLNRKYALRRSAYEIKTIARDVLLATGKHPEMRPLNGHLEILKENFKRVDNSSDLSTLRWDLIDPGDPPPEALVPDVIELEDEDADDEEEEPQPQPPHSPMTSNSVGYSAFRQNGFGPDGQPLPKKKGRPVGWRKSIHSKEAIARASGSSPQPFSASRASASRPSGLRTSQTSNGVVLIESRSPSVVTNRKAPSSYSVFKCEWEGCSAELHNMATLTKHVERFHHGQNAQQKWPCYWTGCEENERYMDKRTGKPNGFRVKEDLTDHVKFAHLGPRSWELGDGHAGGLSESHDSASEAYLSDSRTGRRVTPLVSAPSREAVDVAMAAPAPVPRGPGRPKRDGQKPLDVQTEMERKKKLVGPGLDRGGARLANEKRRMGFIDDEDFEEIVSDSD
ncbi:hypothetical protein SLS58_004253 [Diplodia intermedia]|uniref:C2H2-type domain-containing protein n=1 Tax=Diplodia intermedia TaxID=856260 RepID=A0ABR3TUN3_9PEZI